MKIAKKKFFWGVGLVLLIIILININLIIYGIGQLRGQMHIISNAKPVSYFLNDPQVPDSVKYKLNLVAAIKSFAVDSLGINPNDNYTTMFDQKGQPVLWIVTGAKPFALEPKTWSFPILGEVTYKGYFSLEKTERERDRLLEDGWEVGIRTVSGWSTLGWFKDPILSEMLARSEGSLSNLIIHELAHGTIYVKDSTELNENLATFIGDYGAELFLKNHYGSDSEILDYYLKSEADYHQFSRHMLRGAGLLDSLYATFNESMPDTQKRKRKENMIKVIVQSLDTISFNYPEPYIGAFTYGPLPDNNYFMRFLRYQSQQDYYTLILEDKFEGDLRAFIAYYKELYPYL